MSQKHDKALEKFWEDVLKKEKLSMQRGRHAKLTYIADNEALARIAGERQTRNGRVKAKGRAD